MASGTRTRLDPDARRAQLIELGLDVLSSRPLDQVSVDEIAAAAGISRGLLFHYFPTKRDYLVAVVRAAAAELLAVTDPDPSLPMLDRLREGLEGYVGFIEHNQPAYVSLVRGALGADEQLAAVFEETRAAIVERILSQLEAGDPSAAMRIAVRGWVGMVEEAAIEWLRDRAIERAQLVAMLESVLVHALAQSAPLPA